MEKKKSKSKVRIESKIVDEESVIKKEDKVKTVQVNITTPFRFARELRDKNTKRLPTDVANWMVKKRFGKIICPIQK